MRIHEGNYADCIRPKNIRDSGSGNLIVGSILAVLYVLLATTVVLAQTGGQSGGGSAAAGPSGSNLSGVWMWAAGRGEGGRNRFSMTDPPMQPAALAKYKANRAGTSDRDAPGLEKMDPSTYCFPSGVPRNMLGSRYPFEIVQNPKRNSNRILILVEADNAVRQIWMDGREHPTGWPFGWMGHSTGKWEQDTLVVETVSRNDRTWLDFAGSPHSDALRIVERMRRLDHSTLEIEFLFEDPNVFTKPWGTRRLYQLRPDSQIAENVACEEHLKIGN